MTVLNVTSEKKNFVKNSLENPNSDIFVELQKEMVLSMKLNSWLPFVKTELGRAVINTLEN